jgi:electron transfer flavoprotein beta subunit
MKIAVCVKHVPDGQLAFDPQNKRLRRSGSGTLNSFDANAVEEALRLRGENGEVVVVSMGPPAATESLRSALALGADRAVLASDDSFAGADLLATSTVLAKVLETEHAELVLFGQGTTDSGGSLLWAAVAERLALPVVSQAVEMALDGFIVRVKRQTEFGYDTIATPLPAVVAVSDAINEPRYASLKGMMGAKKKPLQTLSLAEIGLDPSVVGEAGSMTTVREMREPPARSNARKIEDDGNASQVIFDFLVEKELI